MTPTFVGFLTSDSWLRTWGRIGFLALALALCSPVGLLAGLAQPLPKIVVAPGNQGFQTEDGQRSQPLGVTYYRPGTGWAPQVWKQFDLEAVRRDFARMKEVGVNCVRVFTSYGSFLTQPDALSPEGVSKFDQFLEAAEAAGLYVHPTGPDHWEGLPEWARQDRVANDQVLEALETFWRLFAARYRGRTSIFAYDLRNEPEVSWDTPVMRQKWNRWLERRYASPEERVRAWGREAGSASPGSVAVPPRKDNPGDRELLDYQTFREEIADEWTRRQVAAIKAVDPDALVTVGLIQWSVPCLLPQVSHYSGFRPERQAKLLDFMEVHFYPLARGFYEYASAEDEARNLAYLESVVREVAKPGKPVVIAEFGWYGGGKLTVDQGRHPAASEEQQARWCLQLVETSAPFASGWLNWGFFDHPQARDVSQLTGLLTEDARLKAWGWEFRKLARGWYGRMGSRRLPGQRPELDWEQCLTSTAAGHEFRERYYQAFRGAGR